MSPVVVPTAGHAFRTEHQTICAHAPPYNLSHFEYLRETEPMHLVRLQLDACIADSMHYFSRAGCAYNHGTALGMVWSFRSPCIMYLTFMLRHMTKSNRCLAQLAGLPWRPCQRDA